jgi:hypothetical protein
MSADARMKTLFHCRHCDRFYNVVLKIDTPIMERFEGQLAVDEAYLGEAELMAYTLRGEAVYPAKCCTCAGLSVEGSPRGRRLEREFKETAAR